MGESDVVIRVEGLGKKYTIKHEQPARHNTFRNVVAEQAKVLGRWANPFTLAGQLRRARRQADQQLRQGEEDFWALKDVSFEIRRGERVGIIGRNGAGKSTLLKILSRITEPTTGRVEIRGRVASLLEVGTGFHPELTGRENIYLNGAILGMTRREIRAKFDEIVDFAEVEKFLDTPVKRYSSGMYVRLAFAIAGHLEPEIMILDEVLAVGDEGFQNKCLGLVQRRSSRDGVTTLIVSHSLITIRKLSTSCLFIKRGQALLLDPEKAVEKYREPQDTTNTQSKNLGPISVGNVEIQVFNNQAKLETSLLIALGIKVAQRFQGDIEFVIRDYNYVPILFIGRHLDLTPDPVWNIGTQDFHTNSRINGFLAGGVYYLDILVVETGKKVIAEASRICTFNVAGPRLSADDTSSVMLSQWERGCLLLNS